MKGDIGMNPLSKKYITEHSALLEKWRRRHEAKGYTDFIYDGIINPNIDEWFNQKERVLFILKEGYNKEKPGHPTSLVKALRDPKQRVSRIWKNVCRWYYCLTQITSQDIPSFEECMYSADNCTNVERCAIINIKKSDGKSESDSDNLKAFVKDDNDLIKQQIELINPTIIICGYTFHLLKDYPSGKLQADYKIFSCDTSKELDAIGCYDINNKLVISYYHPSNHYPDNLNYYGFAGLYRDYLCKGKEQR